MPDAHRMMIDGNFPGAVFESRQGSAHAANEDFLQAIALPDGSTFLAVYDGISTDGTGAQDSERAAFLLRDKLKEKAIQSVAQNREAFFDELLAWTNRKLYEWNVARGLAKYSGTTIAAASVDPGRERLYTIHMGDSRVYLFASGKLHPLTRDHGRLNQVRRCLAAEMLDVPAEIHTYLWPPREMGPAIKGKSGAGGAFLLLCSDGLHDLIAGRKAFEDSDFAAQARAIEKIILGNLSDGLPAIATALITAGVETGKGDDVSVIVFPL